jgi:hypothetical protein
MLHRREHFIAALCLPGILALLICLTACRDKGGSNPVSGLRDPRLASVYITVIPSVLYYETMDSVQVTVCVYDGDHVGIPQFWVPLTVSTGHFSGSQLTNVSGCAEVWWWPLHKPGYPCVFFGLGMDPDSMCIEVGP